MNVGRSLAARTRQSTSSIILVAARRSVEEATFMIAIEAIAGGVAFNIITIILWMMVSIPGSSSVPEEPKAAIIAFVSIGIGAAIMYFAPSNKETVAVTSTERDRETAGGFRADRVFRASSFRLRFGRGASSAEVTYDQWLRSIRHWCCTP